MQWAQAGGSSVAEVFALPPTSPTSHGATLAHPEESCALSMVGPRAPVKRTHLRSTANITQPAVNSCNTQDLGPAETAVPLPAPHTQTHTHVLAQRSSPQKRMTTITMESRTGSTPGISLLKRRFGPPLSLVAARATAATPADTQRHRTLRPDDRLEGSHFDRYRDGGGKSARTPGRDRTARSDLGAEKRTTIRAQ